MYCKKVCGSLSFPIIFKRARTNESALGMFKHRECIMDSLLESVPGRMQRRVLACGCCPGRTIGGPVLPLRLFFKSKLDLAMSWPRHASTQGKAASHCVQTCLACTDLVDFLLDHLIVSRFWWRSCDRPPYCHTYGLDTCLHHFLNQNFKHLLRKHIQQVCVCVIQVCP